MGEDAMAMSNRCATHLAQKKNFSTNKISILFWVFLVSGGSFPYSAMAATCPSDKEKEEVTCPDVHSNNPTFLFAHGLNGNPGEWQHFADRVRAQGFGVWRTQLDHARGHISERGDQLAAFIGSAAQKCNTKPKSVIAVGHSMGGLDLRYIVGRSQDAAGRVYTKATDLIRSVYTIATPHLGDPNACAAPGGTHDLCGHVTDNSAEESPMKRFNQAYPASDFAELRINFMAIFYECPGKERGEDGVVLLDSQKWLGAWPTKEEAQRHMHDGGKGYHKNKTDDGCREKYGCLPELCQDEEIDGIMSIEGTRRNFDQHAKILFYKKNECKDDPIGEMRLNYSRTYCSNGIASCDLPFKNDEARSMRLVQVKKGTQVNIYNSPNCSDDDDYSVVEMKKDVEGCIDSFEEKLDNDKINLSFHKNGVAMNHLDGKVSCVKAMVPKPY